MKGAAAAVQLDAHQLSFEPQGSSVSLRVTSKLQISGGHVIGVSTIHCWDDLQVSGGHSDGLLFVFALPVRVEHTQSIAYCMGSKRY